MEYSGPNPVLNQLLTYNFIKPGHMTLDELDPEPEFASFFSNHLNAKPNPIL